MEPTPAQMTDPDLDAMLRELATKQDVERLKHVMDAVTARFIRSVVIAGVLCVLGVWLIVSVWH